MSDRDLPGTLPSRREVLRRVGAGFGSMALAALLADERPRPRRRQTPCRPARPISRAGPGG